MNFYLPASGQVIPDYLLQRSTGFSPNTDPGVLAANGIYTVIPATNPYDPFLYQATATYTVVGNYAQQGWTATGWTLSDAKQGGSFEAKQTANTQESQIVASSGLSPDVLTAVSSQDPLDRPAQFQVVLDAMATVSDNLDSNLTAIDAATSVDEINNIVNPPTGTIQIYRTGATLDESFYVSFTSASLTEADTELYVPGSSTTIAYDTLNSNFPQTPAAFSPGDFLIQIRVTSSGQVLKEFLVTTTPTDVTF